MRQRLIIVTIVALAGGPAFAQTTNTAGNAAIKDSAPHTTAMATKGRNSFTEKQAIRRLAKAGYVASTLSKDAEGVWAGTAAKAGKTVTVGLDFKGNITER